jgi:hypothetical protein
MLHSCIAAGFEHFLKKLITSRLQKITNVKMFLLPFRVTSALILSFLVTIDMSYGALRKVSSSSELQSALDSASPGDTIQLAPTVFMGDFVASKDGPITITGDYNSTIVSEGGTAFTIKGNKWTLKSFKITEPEIAVLVEGSENSLEGLVMQKVGRGIVLRGPGNKVKSVVISEAEGGIIVEADKNNLYYNSVNIQAPSITLEENTCCGVLDGNVANGRVDLRGSKYELKNNVANHGMYVTGCDNSFMGNVANGASFPKECQSIDLGGNVYRGLGPNDTELPVAGQTGQDGQQQQGQLNGSKGGNQQQYNNNQQLQQGQSFAAQVTGGGSKPQCTCTCV